MREWNHSGNLGVNEGYDVDFKAATTDPQLDTVFFGRFAVTMKKR